MLKILLVYDDFQELTSVELMLKKIGFDVVGITSEFALAEKLLSFNPQIVVAQGRTAKVSSASVGRRLRESARWDGQSVLVFYPNAKPQASELLKIRMDVGLEYPLEPTKFVQVLAQLGGLDSNQLLDKLIKNLVPDAKIAEQKDMIQQGKSADSGSVLVSGGRPKQDEKIKAAQGLGEPLFAPKGTGSNQDSEKNQDPGAPGNKSESNASNSQAKGSVADRNGTDAKAAAGAKATGSAAVEDKSLDKENAAAASVTAKAKASTASNAEAAKDVEAKYAAARLAAGKSVDAKTAAEAAAKSKLKESQSASENKLKEVSGKASIGPIGTNEGKSGIGAGFEKKSNGAELANVTGDFTLDPLLLKPLAQDPLMQELESLLQKKEDKRPMPLLQDPRRSEKYSQYVKSIPVHAPSSIRRKQAKVRLKQLLSDIDRSEMEDQDVSRRNFVKALFKKEE